MQHYISGIQQIGIGVTDAMESMKRYKSLFGMDALVFNDISDAALMTKYTGGEIYNRQAVLSMNLQGGGGFEIWQFRNRQPSPQPRQIHYGDIGIYAGKIKAANVKESYNDLKKNKDCAFISDLFTDPKGEDHFYVRDLYGNYFNIVACDHWFQKGDKKNGGIAGAVIGVTNMERSLKFYRDVLGISDVIYDITGAFNDNPESENSVYRRVLLHKAPNGKGAFYKLLGSIDIELVECKDRTPQKLFENRFWGDCGFIHLCFDVLNMDGLKLDAHNKGFDFTVDSNDSFPMENASGRFCYVEDPDGTLIELVETHRVPILKKLGLYLNLKKRDIEKPLPDWMIRMLGLSKVK